MSQHTEILPPPPGSEEAESSFDSVGNPQVDYFGFQEEETFYLPDGQSWITFQKMNEGKRAAFQKASSRDLVLERRSGDARMKVDPGGDRHALIRSSITGWNLKRQGQPVPFHEKSVKDFLELADPRIVDELEKAIRKANPWLIADMSPEDIQKEIDSLEEMKREAEEREAGKLASNSK
jgi:hypothetical protein